MTKKELEEDRGLRLDAAKCYGYLVSRGGRKDGATRHAWRVHCFIMKIPYVVVYYNGKYAWMQIDTQNLPLAIDKTGQALASDLFHSWYKYHHVNPRAMSSVGGVWSAVSGIRREDAGEYVTRLIYIISNHLESRTIYQVDYLDCEEFYKWYTSVVGLGTGEHRVV